MTKTEKSFVRFFNEACKPRGCSRLGVEAEHFIVHRDTLEAVSYSGEAGVREILKRLFALYPEAVILPDDDFFGFDTGRFTITIEPAAQLEISIVPEVSVSEINLIYSDFRKKLDGILRPLSYIALNAGCHPTTPVDQMEMIPKERYRLMGAHFKGTGDGGRQMMRGTASLQVSIDYQSEEDFRRKFQAAYYFSPVLKLFCDNAKTFQGEPVEGFLKRSDIWRRVDKNRCMILPDVFSPKLGFSDYAAFLLRMKPIFIKEDGKAVPTGERTVSEIYPDKDLSDAELRHILSMAFPPVRLKQFIEIRVADSVPQKCILAYAALIKGLLYNNEILSMAQREIRDKMLDEDAIRRTENSLMEKGWDGGFYGESIREAAERLLGLARESLEEDERNYLDAFSEVLKHGGIERQAADHE